MFELDIVPTKNALDTLALGPKNPVLEKFDQNVMLAEIVNRFQEENVSNETFSYINITAVNYIRKCSKQSIPRNVIMMKKYIKGHDLLKVPIGKGPGICLKQCQASDNKLMGVLKLKQFKKMGKACENAKELCLKEEERVNTVLREPSECGGSDEQLLISIKTVCGQLPRLYGIKFIS